jgi:hypothetical protein
MAKVIVIVVNLFRNFFKPHYSAEGFVWGERQLKRLSVGEREEFMRIKELESMSRKQYRRMNALLNKMSDDD